MSAWLLKMDIVPPNEKKVVAGLYNVYVKTGFTWLGYKNEMIFAKELWEFCLKNTFYLKFSLSICLFCVEYTILCVQNAKEKITLWKTFVRHLQYKKQFLFRLRPNKLNLTTIFCI